MLAADTKRSNVQNNIGITDLVYIFVVFHGSHGRSY